MARTHWNVAVATPTLGSFCLYDDLIVSMLECARPGMVAMSFMRLRRRRRLMPVYYFLFPPSLCSQAPSCRDTVPV